MNYPIKISKEYLDVLKSLLKIYNDLPNKRHALFFKKDEHVYVSAMSLNTLVTVKASSNHMQFDDNEIGVHNLTQFMHYIDAINYPDDKDAEILNVTEKSTKGKDIHSFLFKGKYGSYRMPIAHPAEFDKNKDRKVPTERDKDALKLVAKVHLDKDDTKMLVKDINLMNKAKNFIISIMNSKISMYIKGSEQQQYTRDFDDLKAVVYDNYTTEKNGNNTMKLFSSRIIDYMAYLGCEFEVEVRIKPDNTLMALKCWGTISNDGSDDIDVFIGTHENSADVSSGNLELVQ